MAEKRLLTEIGRQIALQEHFNVPVLLEDVRPLGSDGSAVMVMNGACGYLMPISMEPCIVFELNELEVPLTVTVRLMKGGDLLRDQTICHAPSSMVEGRKGQAEVQDRWTFWLLSPAKIGTVGDLIVEANAGPNYHPIRLSFAGFIGCTSEQGSGQSMDVVQVGVMLVRLPTGLNRSMLSAMIQIDRRAVRGLPQGTGAVILILFVCVCVTSQMLGAPVTMLGVFASDPLAESLSADSLSEGYSIPPPTSELDLPSRSSFSVDFQPSRHLPIFSSAVFHPPVG